MSILRTPDNRFADLPGYNFAPHYLTVPDQHLGPLRMHYLDEGDPDGQPVLLVHGEPTWSYMFRRTVPVLASAGMRVVVPDLIGFGSRTSPANSATTATRHTFGGSRTSWDRLDSETPFLWVTTGAGCSD